MPSADGASLATVHVSLVADLGKRLWNSMLRKPTGQITAIFRANSVAATRKTFSVVFVSFALLLKDPVGNTAWNHPAI